MDAQLRSIREAARERFVATRGEAKPAPQTSAGAPMGQATFLGGIPRERMNAPISSLLADAPAEPPVAKRPRASDVEEVRVPPERTAEVRRLLELPLPQELRVLTWNIDGLDEVGGAKGLMLRTLEVALEVARHRPAAVFLQEVVPPALEVLSHQRVLGSTYEVVVPKDPPLPYYVAILVDRRQLRRHGPPQTVNFPGTSMGRQLLAVAAQPIAPATGPRGGGALLLATAHLESMKDHGAERKRQLAQSARFLLDAVGRPAPGAGPLISAAVLGGDLNIRDEEVKAAWRELGTEASRVVDAWAYCGSPEQAKWTWDTVENNNLAAPYKYRSRFDRVLFVSPGITESSSSQAGVKAKAKGKAKAKAKAEATSPTASTGALAEPGVDSSAAQAAGWRPTAVELVGRQRVPGLGRFPSDHWGVLTTWSCGESKPAPMAAASAPTPAPTPAAPPPASASKAPFFPLSGDSARRVVIDLDE